MNITIVTYITHISNPNKQWKSSMGNPKNKLKTATEGPRKPWNIQNFPVNLRKGFMAAATLQEMTGKELMEQQITQYLKHFFKGTEAKFQ